MAKKQVIKVGDLVRVHRATGFRLHAHRSGSLGEVVEVDIDGTARVCVRGLHQWVPIHNLKLAKQAMKKREAYRDRR